MAAGGHSGVISDKGDAFFWGTSIFKDSTRPHQVKALSKRCRKIVIGTTVGCLMTDKGLVYVWGLNTQGELGTGDCKPRMSPYPL